MDPSVAVTAYASKVAHAISSAAKSSRNEAEFRSSFSHVLRDFAADCGIPFEVREEYVLATGRLDAAYNRLVIEYESPGSLRANPAHQHTVHAVQQVKDYLLGIAAKDREKIHRLAGVVVDGYFFRFCEARSWAVRCGASRRGQRVHYNAIPTSTGIPDLRQGPTSREPDRGLWITNRDCRAGRRGPI